jgi:hypothetical protein
LGLFLYLVCQHSNERDPHPFKVTKTGLKTKTKRLCCTISIVANTLLFG